ncbi:MAG TPA: RHS repeat-associated core domain-containing protein [Caldilineaceae bacterium]|nr:RHS repeat-associated core domain-containing protein [Caldilineaceae bacterium]
METSASGASTASRTYYAYGSTRSSSGTLQTDRTYTGQKQDGTGLLYMNARYYDSTLGVFLSPDTLVPDAGRVVDYNRFLYVRGNPLKYNDPSGHYSNEEIMQHYGCEDWVCVEAFFHNDGAYAGMWGWLYILQMAQDGDRLTATYGWTGNSLQGVFQRSQRGSIDLRVSDSWVWPSAVFAFHPANGRFAGNYSLNAGSGDAVFTAVGTKHQFRVTPSQIDQTEAGLGFLKAGTDFGPQLAKSPNPYAATAGLLWTAAGAASTVYSDFVVPIQEATQKNPGPTVDLIVDALLEVAAVRIEARSKPYISPAIDASRALWPALCWGTQCFGR